MCFSFVARIGASNDQGLCPATTDGNWAVVQNLLFVMMIQMQVQMEIQERGANPHAEIWFTYNKQYNWAFYVVRRVQPIWPDILVHEAK